MECAGHKLTRTDGTHTRSELHFISTKIRSLVLHKEKPHYSCTSQLIIDMIKSDIIRLVGNVAHMGRNEFIRGFNNPKLIENLGDVDIDGKIILTFRCRNFLLNFSTPCI